MFIQWYPDVYNLLYHKLLLNNLRVGLFKMDVYPSFNDHIVSSCHLFQSDLEIILKLAFAKILLDPKWINLLPIYATDYLA